MYRARMMSVEASQSLVKRVLVCCDTFKGSATSCDAGVFIENALRSTWSAPEQLVVEHCPMSDGGAGLLETVLWKPPPSQSVKESTTTGEAAALGFDRVTVPHGRIIVPLIPFAHRYCAVTSSSQGHTPSLSGCAFAFNPTTRVLVVETAQANGLPLVPEAERNPMHTSSFGVGQLLKFALEHAAQTTPESTQPIQCFVGIGGSSTNDGGIGALQALGMRLLVDRSAYLRWRKEGSVEDSIKPQGATETLDELNTPLTGELLPFVKRIETTPAFIDFCQRFILPQSDTNAPLAQLSLICDVTNPLLGPNGATRVYGPQKGAKDEKAKLHLERGLENVARLVSENETLRSIVSQSVEKVCASEGKKEKQGKQHDLRSAESVRAYLESVAGGGAAGGIGCFFHAVLHAHIQRGTEAVARLTSLREKLAEADVVITGEGSFDEQTIAYAKTVGCILTIIHEMASSAPHSPSDVLVLCGRSGFASDADVQREILQHMPKSTLPHRSPAKVNVHVHALTPRFDVSEAMSNPSKCLEVLFKELHGLQGMLNQSM